MAHELIKQGRFVTIVLSGSVDLSDSGAIKAAAEAEMSPDMSELRVDGGGLDYIDSSGVAALLYLKKTASRCNATFTITAMSLGGRRVIELAKLQTVLGLSASVPLSAHGASGGSANAAGALFRESDAVQAITAGGGDDRPRESPPPAASAPPSQQQEGLGSASPPGVPSTGEAGQFGIAVKPGSFS